jgi:hypothetical protein
LAVAGVQVLPEEEIFADLSAQGKSREPIDPERELLAPGGVILLLQELERLLALAFEEADERLRVAGLFVLEIGGWR